MVSQTEGKFSLRTMGERQQTAGSYRFDPASGQLCTDSSQVVGRFSLETLSKDPLNFSPLESEERRRMPVVSICPSEIMAEIQKPSNAGAYFVLPSQLNGAEYLNACNAYIVRELQAYCAEGSGGPRGQLAVHPAVGQFLLDNAASQTNDQGINSVADVLDSINRDLPEAMHFQSVNGYFRIPHAPPGQRAEVIQKLRGNLHKLRLIVMEDVPATGLNPDRTSLSSESHSVHVAYCSGVPMGTYVNGIRGGIRGQGLLDVQAFQQRVAESLLVAQYWGVLQHAAREAAKQNQRKTVFLMLLGAGAFKTSLRTIAKSLSAALEMLPPGSEERLDIRMLTFQPNSQEAEDFGAQLRDFHKLLEKPGSEPLGA